MSEEQVAQERPCLHCMMVELIDDFFAEYPATPGGSDTVDTDEGDEVIVAIAKTVAELTWPGPDSLRKRSSGNGRSFPSSLRPALPSFRRMCLHLRGWPSRLHRGPRRGAGACSSKTRKGARCEVYRTQSENLTPPRSSVGKPGNLSAQGVQRQRRSSGARTKREGRQPNLDAPSGPIAGSAKAVRPGRYACPRRSCRQDI